MKIIIKLIIFGLIFTFLNNLESYACQDRAKQSSVKSNMHDLQTMLETYAVDWKGIYPKNIKELKKEGLKKTYWKRTKNPYTGKETVFITTYIDEQSLNDNFVSDSNYLKGDILYIPLIDKKIKNITSYKIFGIIKAYPQKESVISSLNNFLNYINLFSFITPCQYKIDFFSSQISDFIYDNGKIFYLSNK